jgi:hypothetical protein
MPTPDESGPGAAATAHRAYGTAPTSIFAEEIPMDTIQPTSTPGDPAAAGREFHSHDRPRCSHCGDEHGPWRPTGGHCEHGVQLFECSPGRGCAIPSIGGTPDWSAYTAAQLDGLACVLGGRPFGPGDVSVPHGHGPNGQLFRCAECPYPCRVNARVRPLIARAEQPLLLIADVADLTVPEVRARYDGAVPWNTDEIELVAALFGVDPFTLLGVDE